MSENPHVHEELNFIVSELSGPHNDGCTDNSATDDEPVPEAAARRSTRPRRAAAGIRYVPAKPAKVTNKNASTKKASVAVTPKPLAAPKGAALKSSVPTKPGVPSTSASTSASTATTTQPAEPHFKCSICQHYFYSKIALTVHVRNHFHKHICPICDQTFLGDTAFEYHMQNEHADMVQPKRPAVAPLIQEQCKHCAAVLLGADELHSHMLAEHTDRIKWFKCAHCEERFPSRNQETIHRYVEHADLVAEQFACDICARVCRNRDAVLQHRLTHVEEEKLFACPVCGKGFTRRGNLEFHERTHTGEREFACDLCPMKFTHVSGLTCHRRSHTKERPYKCPFCSKSYMHCTDLRRHRRTHGGEEKRFECEMCGKKFYEKKFLRVHAKVHREVTSKVISIEMKVLKEGEEEVGEEVVDSDESMVEEYVL